jgi:NRPS condensation-like uncharacterized protein
MEKIRILTERLFLRSPNINVCFKMSIAGNLDANKFQLAINDVCKRHPLLNCSIETDKEHNAWFVQNRGSIKIEYYSSEEMHWQDWYKRTDNIPFDLRNGPLAKICAIHCNDKIDIIVLGHHIIGDGIGYLNLAKDILLSLDTKLEITPQIPPLNNKFRRGGKLKFLSKIYAKKLNAEWGKNRVNFSENDYRVFFRQYRTKFVPEMYVNSIDEINLKKLMIRAKENDFTVNELLTSAFSVAMAELLNDYCDKEIRVGVAASTRNELTTEPYCCMGNYVTGIAAGVKFDREKDFIANAKNISAVIRKKLTRLQERHLIVNFLNAFDTDLVESIMFAAYGNYQLPAAKKIGELIGERTDKKGLGISNLGRHEIDGYNTLRLLDMQFIGPAFPANLLSVNIITVNNRLAVCLRYTKAEIETAIVEKIYQRVVDLLLQ